MFTFGTSTTYDREAALNWLLHTMNQETRMKLATEMPLAYNRLCDQTVVKVVHIRTGKEL